MIKRKITEKIEEKLFKGKIVIIYGPRQVGKTTLSKELLKKYGNNSAYFNCDEPDVCNALTNKTSTELINFIGNKKFIVIDEAQRVENIGLTLKLLIDNFPEMQVIATGSSSFDLANKINEPLTGRKYEFKLFPFSVEELFDNSNLIEVSRNFENRLIFGLYPEIISLGNSDKIDNLKLLSDSYLFKDILSFGKIKKSDVLVKLLKALALQVGSQVSYTELAGLVGVDKNTVESYIEILEQAFIIFKLSSFSRNLRNELKFAKKIYFYDNGIRNVLLNNFNGLDLRNDIGALWENFLLSERQKFLDYHKKNRNFYFWRNYAQAEIDYIEEFDGKISAYEFKWGNKKAKMPKNFFDNYPESIFNLVNKENYLDFIFGKN